MADHDGKTMEPPDNKDAPPPVKELLPPVKEFIGNQPAGPPIRTRRRARGIFELEEKPIA